MKKPRRRGGHNKGPKGQAREFTEKQVQKIKHWLIACKDTKQLALFLTAIDTMLRSSDLLKLKVRDVRTNAGNMKVDFTIKQKKTKKYVDVSIGATTRKALRALIEEENKQDDDYLFTTRNNRPFTGEWFRIFVKRWAEAIGLDPCYYSGHSTRRTQAIYLYENGAKIAEISKALGHRSIKATILYLGLKRRKLMKVLKRKKMKL